jgi:hypothetical protein
MIFVYKCDITKVGISGSILDFPAIARIAGMKYCSAVSNRPTVALADEVNPSYQLVLADVEGIPILSTIGCPQYSPALTGNKTRLLSDKIHRKQVIRPESMKRVRLFVCAGKRGDCCAYPCKKHAHNGGSCKPIQNFLPVILWLSLSTL